jgi:hypothetical protein
MTLRARRTTSTGQHFRARADLLVGGRRLEWVHAAEQGRDAGAEPLFILACSRDGSWAERVLELEPSDDALVAPVPLPVGGRRRGIGMRAMAERGEGERRS